MAQTTLPGRAGRGIGALVGGVLGFVIGLLWTGYYGAPGLEPYADLIVAVLIFAGIFIGFFAGRTVGRIVHRRTSG